nr:16S rRNA (guanine(527)-N(7))-methyltransferase RsmG [Lutimaribacter sp. EGI FJ00013]
MDRLQTYVALLEKWNPRINLVAKSTLDAVWTRHVQDSLQLLSLAPPKWQSWADLGSGGGFPGLVIAIVAKELYPESKVTLVESDQRKSVFLRTVLRETEVQADVIAKRIEALPPLEADVVSARALADLKTLLGFVAQHGSPAAIALFPKGATWEKEVADARVQWEFACEPFKSDTEEKSVILKIEGVARV